ncbi:MAG: hypothetical protein V2I67_19090 [Thermoanaerobaculales bacterium]|nr:hypothetical protein [Thermoanaerobaculales bacterium]
MKISLVVVCHHSSRVLPFCVGGFRAGAAAAGFEPEVVVVEQSEDAAEAAAVADCAPDLTIVRPNRGYAAGLNAGAAASSGEVLFLANPDIEFLDGSVGALAEVAAGVGVIAGPQLLWDRGGELLLPIPDDPGPMAELGRTVRRRWPRRRDLERRVEASWRVWTADEPCAVPSLRGPLMAVNRGSMERFGSLDEGYFLYYEETEWLWRARRSGARLRLVPKARVAHRWGHATARRGDRAEIEGRSRIRFFRRNYPAPFRALLRALSAPRGSQEDRFEVVDDPASLCEPKADVWLLSIVSQMEPFVGCVGTSTLPSAALDLTSSGRWYAVAVRRDGSSWRATGHWMWEKE